MVSLNKDSLKHWQDNDLEHLRYEYPLKPEDTVLDIGSYQREWGNKIAADYGCKVEYFDALDQRAAWVFDGDIHMGGSYYYTSMFLPHTSSFKCVDIAGFLQSEMALVKINIEGGEYQLLDYILSSGLMKNVKYLQVQFHIVEGQDYEEAYNSIINRLSLTHKRQWNYPFCWESWERVWI